MSSLTWLTVWTVGLVIALLTGNLSLYVILSVLYWGSRRVARLRRGDDSSPAELEP